MPFADTYIHAFLPSRPLNRNIEVVGDTFVPILKVTDFAPYVAKMQKSGADAIITGNWGNDMSLLGKALKDSKLPIKLYTLYGGSVGIPRAMGPAMEGVRAVAEAHVNVDGTNKTAPFTLDAQAFEAKYNVEWVYHRLNTMVNMFAKALEKAGTADPVKVAYALEGMTMNTWFGKATMRDFDHQLIQPLFVSVYKKKDGNMVRFDQEGSGYGPATEIKLSAAETALPSSCKMKRP